MKTMVKTIAISLGVLALLAAAGYYFVLQHSSRGEEITEVAEKIKEREEVQDTTANETASSETEADMSEQKLQIHLHHMTHQKVTAPKKIGAVEMTPANIDSLLTIVQANTDYYEHSDFYLAALTAWQQGDFSNAVNVHNTIWEWQEGTVGRATGLMSAEQESVFVEEQFK